MSYERYKDFRLAPDDNGCWSVLDKDYQQKQTFPSQAAAKRWIDAEVQSEECLCKEDGFAISRTLCTLHGHPTPANSKPNKEPTEAIRHGADYSKVGATSNSIAELREAIADLMIEHYANHHISFNRKEVLVSAGQILAIFQAHQQELLSEARLSERAWAYKNMRDHGTDPQWIEIARLRMERLINAGKLDNSNPPIQKLDKSVQNKTNDGGNHGD